MPADQADELMAEISRRLIALRDPTSGAQVVLRVDRARDVYSGERVSEGPDLVVGYNVHYGGSDASTLGEITEAVVITASGCGAMVKDYGHLLRDDPAYAERAARVSELARDPSELLTAEDVQRVVGTYLVPRRRTEQGTNR